MRSLHFDIDGTLLALDEVLAKRALVDGVFEEAVRAAQINRLICVGNFVKVIHLIRELQADYDGLGMILRLSGGVFHDEQWFRRITVLSRDPENRATELPLDQDWWYLDDLAQEYLRKAGREDVFRQENGRRVFAPCPSGDGRDVLEWLSFVGTARRFVCAIQV